MSDDSGVYVAALKAARTRFKTATRRLEENRLESQQLEEEITKIRRTITALSAVCSVSPGLDNLGITETVDAVMAEATSVMTSSEVTKALANEGFDLDSQKNASASVHAVLTRLASAGKIEKTTKALPHPNGKDKVQAIAWKGPKYDPNDVPF